MSKRNILYISYDGMTDPLGQSQVLPYLCGLSQKGFNIHLISAEKKERFSKNASIINSICTHFDIKWHPIPYSKNPPILSTLFDIFRLKTKATKLNSLFNFEIVHCRSYIPSFIGLYMKRRYKTPYIFDMRGFWIDEKIDGNIWNLKNPIFKLTFDFMKKKEKSFFRGCSQIVSLTNKAIPTIRQIIGKENQPKKINVIPCCVDVTHFDRNVVSENAIHRWKEKLNISNTDYIISYLGSLSTWYLPNEMLKFFITFKAKVPHAKFLIITTEDPQPFRIMANEIGVPEEALIFTSSERSELPSLLSLSNSSIFFIKPAFSKIASSPTKLGELLSMGIPVICNTGIGDTDEMINASASGVICKSFNELEYERCTQEILQLETTLDKNFTRKKAIELFSLERGVELYYSIYQSLISTSDDKVHS